MFASQESSSSRQRGGHRSRQTGKASDLFLGRKDKAKVAILIEREQSFGRQDEGLDDLQVPASMEERACLERMVSNPSSTLKDILARQSVMDALVDPSFDLQSFRRIQGAAYSLGAALKYLREPDSKAEREDPTSRRSRVEVLLSEGLTAENWKSKAEEALRRIESDRFNNPSEEQDEALTALIGIEEGVSRLQDLASALKNIQNPLLSRLGREIEAAADKIPAISVSDFIDCTRGNNSGSIKAVEEAVEEVSADIIFAGALAAFAYNIKRLGMGRASFDEGEPENYRNGWNYLKEKETTRWISDKSFRQVLCGSPRDNGLTLYAGPNMSGKSFGLERDFYIPLCAQAFGYGPFETANFNVHDSFVFLGRAATDSYQKLSAFGQEIKNWLAAFKAAGKRALVCADESYSTTSPEDQFRLLIATVRYLRNLGAKVIMANHNERFLQEFDGKPQCGVYHFKNRISESGDIEFLYTLDEGLDESRAVEVARKLAMPGRVVDSAQAYLRGDRSLASQPRRTFNRLDDYTEAEREALKLERGSFMGLMPSGDELIVGTDRFEGPILTWTTKDKRRPSWMEEAEEAEQPARERFFELLSLDPDFSYRMTYNGVGAVRNQYMIQYIQDMVLCGGTADSREIFERQRMFRALEAEQAYLVLRRHTEGVWGLAASFEQCDPDSLGGFNRKMLEGVFQDFCGYPRKEAVDILATIVLLNADLSRTESDRPRLEVLIGKLYEIGRVEDEIKEASNRFFNDGTNTKSFDEYLEEGRRISERAAVIAGLPPETESIEACYKEIARQLHEIAKRSTEPFDLKAWDPAELRAVLKKVEEPINEEMKRHIFGMPTYAEKVLHLTRFLDETKHMQLLLEGMRGLDSVHLHQLANYFEGLFSVYFRGLTSGREALEKANEATDEERKRRRLFNRSDLERLQEELLKFSSLIALTQVFHEENYCEVLFNETGDLTVEGAWNILSPKDEQVKNDTHLSARQSFHFSVGTNMSGKTYDLKTLTWCELMAHATGRAPAVSMTTPRFDGVFYFDRVSQKLNQTLSAFGNETEQWKRYYEFAAARPLIFGAFDESFSTTSPRYQEAFSWAVVKEALDRGDYVLFASHNHNLIESVLAYSAGAAAAFHFKTHVGEDGNISFDYIKEPGHTRSEAVAVARKLGLPEEILKIAELVLDDHEEFGS